MAGMSYGWLRWMVAVVVLGVGSGCSSLTARNPSFDVSYGEAREVLEAMREAPAALERPLVFLGPFLDPGIAEALTLMRARRAVANDDFLAGQSFLFWDDFEACRAKALAKVDEMWPSDDPVETVEVDVLAFSMGGLVARYAAMPPDEARGQSRRLNIRNLYTIATPHRGAALAPLLAWGNTLACDMRQGSAFLAKLDAALPHADYNLIAYTRLTDWIVGEPNTAPPGRTAYWVSARPFQMAHVQAPHDARILADVLRRVRGEPPLTAAEPAPLPE